MTTPPVGSRGKREPTGRSIADRSIADRVRALAEAGERLRERPADEVLDVVGEACRRWRDPGPDRDAGEEALASHYTVPRAAVTEILDAAFGAWTRESLREWIAAELGDPAALDGFVTLGGVQRRAFGPRLALFLAARGVSTTPIADLVSALCVKSPAWLKLAHEGDDLTARFAQTVAEVDPELGKALVVQRWERESEEEEKAFAAADVVIATGGAETIATLRRRVAPDTRLVLHGPRLSAAVVLRESLREDADAAIEALARDTAFAGQMGCLSPVVAYVEGSSAEVAALLELLHAACGERWPCPPRQQAGIAERAAFADWRATAELEAARGRLSWTGDVDSAWTIVARRGAGPPDPPPVPHMLTLLPVDDVDQLAGLLARRRGTVAAVGVAGPATRATALSQSLARAGVERICPLGRMQRPPAAWRRDGRTTLADLVRWVDRE